MITDVNIKLCDDLDVKFFNALRNDESNAKSLNWASYNAESENSTLEYIRGKKGNLYTVWLQNSKRIGYVQTSARVSVGPNYIELRDVGIFMDYSQRGNGYAKRVLELIEAEKTSKYGLIAKVDSRNHASINLFKSAGYEVSGNIPVIDSIGLQECSIVYLVKKV